jgi:hypothetical protein
MRYELIEGNTFILNCFIKDDWRLVDTFANPNPQPFFFALIMLNEIDEDKYDFDAKYEQFRVESMNRYRGIK